MGDLTANGVATWASKTRAQHPTTREYGSIGSIVFGLYTAILPILSVLRYWAIVLGIQEVQLDIRSHRALDSEGYGAALGSEWLRAGLQCFRWRVPRGSK